MTPGTQLWIDKAEEDWLVAQSLCEADPPLCDAVCFHAQQAAEKWIKALLHERGIVFPKTHDLAILSELLNPPVSKLQAMREDLERLSTLAVEVRYPGFTAAATQADAAVEAAAAVRRICRRELRLDED